MGPPHMLTKEENKCSLALSAITRHWLLKHHLTLQRDWILELMLRLTMAWHPAASILSLHWCAKIKDEVENLAYQLNEEAERTERPIRRLSKISISGKEIARRIAVKITPSCCLSEKWRIINLLDDIWMLLPEVESLGSWRKGRSVTSVPAEFGIAHSIVSRLWRQFQTTGTAIRGFSSGRLRGTTPTDDRYIVLQAKRNRREKSLDRRLDDRYRVLPWPEDSPVVVCLHDALYGVYL
ncbi:uncharacterized protein TNCV_1410571 [Trichonephila clavipes]|nr:uncharacterized protein TNCV_1410571 [Trichonephila clavipes]